jgi:glycosyltransferase involved in cell wall biosynthesis
MSLSLLEQVRRAEIPAVGAVCDDWMVYGPQVDQWTRSWRRGGARLAGALTGIPARVDLDTAASWAFISDHTRSAARAAGWLLPGAVVLHAGIDAELFRFSEPGPWRWRLLYCGRIDPRKGVDTAVEALAQLPAEATLTIDGGGEDRYRRELESLAARLGVSGRIRFEASPHSDIQAVYAAADAVVVPVTWEEPWGLVPLEAMATGRPVLASRAGGGAAEYLREGENCLQFAPGESSGLAAAVERLANEAELRAQLVAVGVETASQHTDRRYHEALERELISAVATVRGVR